MVSTIICILVALFAVVLLYLTRNNIIDLLDKDVILYDKNYQLKKEALEEAFNCLDLIAQNGVEIKNNQQFITRAKEAYNALLCTMTNAKIYQEFYAKALDISVNGYSVEEIEKFKITCRAELVGKRRPKSEGFKGSVSGMSTMGLSSLQQGTRTMQSNQPRHMQSNRPIPPQGMPRTQRPMQGQEMDEQ
jgi:hypothetical protein